MICISFPYCKQWTCTFASNASPPRFTLLGVGPCQPTSPFRASGLRSNVSCQGSGFASQFFSVEPRFCCCSCFFLSCLVSWLLSCLSHPFGEGPRATAVMRIAIPAPRIPVQGHTNDDTRIATPTPTIPVTVHHWLMEDFLFLIML